MAVPGAGRTSATASGPQYKEFSVGESFSVVEGTRTALFPGTKAMAGQPYAPRSPQGWPSLVKGARLRSWSRRSS